jgi:hypothetical protein
MPQSVSNIWYYGPYGRCPGGYEFCDDAVDQLCAEIRQRSELADLVAQWEHFHTCVACGTVYRCHQYDHGISHGNRINFESCPQCSE